jgi:hypothetical protein
VKLVPTFADRGCRVVSAKEPYSRIFGFLDRNKWLIYLPKSHMSLKACTQLSTTLFCNSSIRINCNRVIEGLLCKEDLSRGTVAWMSPLRKHVFNPFLKHVNSIDWIGNLLTGSVCQSSYDGNVLLPRTSGPASELAEVPAANSMAELEPDNSAISVVDTKCDTDVGFEMTQEDSERSTRSKDNEAVCGKHKFEVKVCHCSPNKTNLPLCTTKKVGARAERCRMRS